MNALTTIKNIIIQTNFASALPFLRRIIILWMLGNN